MVFDQLTKVFRTDRSVADAEKILFLKVEGFGFVSRITRSYPFQVHVFIGLVRQCQSAKACGIVIDLLTVEKHIDLNGEIYGSRINLSIFRDEHITVLGIIAQQRKLPFFIEFVAKQSLDVSEIRPIIAFGVHHAKGKRRVLIACAHQIAELLILCRTFHMGFGSQEAKTQ